MFCWLCPRGLDCSGMIRPVRSNPGGPLAFRGSLKGTAGLQDHSSNRRQRSYISSSGSLPFDAQYQTLRSVSDQHIFVVCRDGAFYEIVPEDIRKQGPWQGQHRGKVKSLKPEYRLVLPRDGYVLVRCEFAVFKPEV